MTEALEHAPLPMAVFRGPELECITASEPWRELFGCNPPRSLLERLHRAYQTQRASQVTLHASTRTYRVVIKPIAGQKLLATCIDCTELQRARAEAVRERAFKAQAVAALSHDLRGPISTVLLWERILRDRPDEVNVRARALDAIRECATLQSSLIAELVDIAAVATNEVWRTRVLVESVVTRAIEVTTRTSQTAFTTDLQSPLGYVHANAERLQQALAKVIDSAARVAGGESPVAVAARRVRRHVEIVVGRPISGRRPERITKLELGIVLASELITLHGGTLQAMRYADGQPPTFSISLPTVRDSRT
jgi:K+-sensing histidine kinase KdpD